MSDYFDSSKNYHSLPIESLHVHPGYTSQDYNNDIALIKLATNIVFNASVMPVCLPAQDSELQSFG